MLDLSGLDALRVSALIEPQDVGGAPSSRLAQIPLEDIDFDDCQPRKHFDPDALEELAATIRQFGVVQPVSVHPHPEVAGRFIVNVGERRVRASRLAGLATIPAIVQPRVDPYVRVVENLAREALSPFELAGFIRERVQAGETRQAIAGRLGKAGSFVSEILELGDATLTVRALFERAICRDVRSLYLLSRASRVNEPAVDAFVESGVPVTRAAVEAFVKRLGSDHAAGTKGDPDELPTSRSPRPRRANAFLVDVGGRAAFLPLSTPPTMSAAQVVYADGSREQVDLNRIRLIQWTRLE